MNYALNIRFFENTLGLEKAAEIAARVGFTHLDYTPPVAQDDWYEQMKRAEQIFRCNALRVHQTHAPFNRYGRYGDTHRLCVDRCAEATAYLGAQFMVVHGDEFDFEHLTFSSEAALDYNHRYFLPYVERAQKEGYRVAFETVFEDWDRRRFSAPAAELLALIRSFDSDSAVCCWDFGHANVAFKKEAPNVIREFGTLIQCTHLHDNTGRDSHQLPMTGNIDWPATVKAMKQIPYTGVLSVEYSQGNMPACLLERFIELTYQATAFLWNAE